MTPTRRVLLQHYRFELVACRIGSWRTDKVDSRTQSVDALNERRRRAVKVRLDGISLKGTTAQCEMSRTTVIAAVKAYEAGGWKAVDVDRGGPVGGQRPYAERRARA